MDPRHRHRAAATTQRSTTAAVAAAVGGDAAGGSHLPLASKLRQRACESGRGGGGGRDGTRARVRVRRWCGDGDDDGDASRRYPSRLSMATSTTLAAAVSEGAASSTAAGGDGGGCSLMRPRTYRRRAARRGLLTALAATVVALVARAVAGAGAVGVPAVRDTPRALGLSPSGGAATPAGAVPVAGRQAGATTTTLTVAATPTPSPSPAEVVAAIAATATVTTSSPSTVVLLQVNGSVEHLLSAVLTLPAPGLPLEDILFGVTSTNVNVLPSLAAMPSGAAAAAPSSVMLSTRMHSSFANGNARVVNVTLVADFDAFVGMTDCSLVASTTLPSEEHGSGNGGAGIIPHSSGGGFNTLEGGGASGGNTVLLGKVTVTYVIVGISVYQHGNSGSPGALVSGDGHSLSLPYTALLPAGATGAADDATATANQLSLGVTIQFANGSSTTSSTSIGGSGSQSSDRGKGMTSQMGDVDASLVSWNAQVAHDAGTCAMGASAVADGSADGGFRLSPGCGFGFFDTPSGEMQLGLNLQPYRAGPLVIGFTWSALTASEADMMDEVWTSFVTIDITGRPPPVVTGVALGTPTMTGSALAAGGFSSAPTLLRPSGGEHLVYQLLNCEGSVDRAVEVMLGGSGAEVGVDAVGSAPGSRVTFLEVPGSYTAVGAPSFNQYVTCASVAGEGKDLPWQLMVTRPSSPGGSSSGPMETVAAVLAPGVQAPLSYDDRKVSISGMSPTGGAAEGGATVTLSGYFPNLQPTRGDGVFFNAVRVPDQNIISVGESTIQFSLPPLSTFGRNTEYTVTVHVAAEVSNGIAFSYWSDRTVAQLEVTGTSTRGDAYELGRCNTARFTVMLQPMSSAESTIRWSVHPRVAGSTASSEVDLLATLAAERATADTLVLESDEVPVGEYNVHVTVALPTYNVTSTSLLRRTDGLTVGVHLHSPPVRAVTVPDAPLRVAALIDTPGCFTPPAEGNDSLVLKWTFMGSTTEWSYRETEARAQASSSEETPARLGWEYVVPQTDLEYGRHPVTLHVSYAGASEVFGTATTVAVVSPSALVARIRTGESSVSLNTRSSLVMVGNESYDPDVVDPAHRSEGLSYVWSCAVAETSTEDPFRTPTDESPAPALDACPLVFLPSTDAPAAWTVPPSAFEGLPSKITHVYYRLVVRKTSANAAVADRTSSPAYLTVQVARDEELPAMTDFRLALRDKRGDPVDPAAVKYFDDVVVHVDSPTTGATWSYSLVSPLTEVAQFLAPSRLLAEHGYYRPDTLGTLGNRLPLGIRAGSLSASTAYVVRVDMEAAGYAVKSTTITLNTLERPSVVFPTPATMEGDTGTAFSAWAGPSFNDSTFVIYFTLTDEQGERTCVGGCTGYPLVRFRVGLPGTYKLTAILYDAQGAAQLDAKTLATPLVVTAAPAADERMRADLLRSFRRGDDASWTGLAKDVAFILSSQNSPAALSSLERMAAAHSRSLSDGTLNDGVMLAVMPDAGWGLSPNTLTVSGSRQQPEANATLTAADIVDPVAGTQTVVGPLASDVSTTADADADTAAPATASAAAESAPSAAASAVQVQSFVSDTVYELIHGGNRLFCNSLPNTMHSEVCISLVNTLALQTCLSAEAVYSLSATVRCCADNVPLRTASKMDGLLSTAFNNLARLAENADCASGSGRRRLLSEAGAPSQIVPDIYDFIVHQATSIVGVDKAAGFATRIHISPPDRVGDVRTLAATPVTDMMPAVNGSGDSLTPFRNATLAAVAPLHHGVLAMAVAANREQLPSLGVYGRNVGPSLSREQANAAGTEGDDGEGGELMELKGLRGDGENNYFFMRPVCLDRIFGATGTKRLLFAYYHSPDFVVNSGIQDVPKYAKTTSGLFTTRIYEEDTSSKTTGKLRPLVVADNGPPCFCWRLPLTNVSAFEETDKEIRPGVYTFTELKKYGVDVAKGEAFHYWEDTVLLVGSSLSERWVEACMTAPGLIGAAPTTRISGPLGFGTTVLAGFNSLTVAGIIVGVMVALVVCLVASWMVATRSTATAVLAPRGLGAGEVFVERDVWGRGTGVGGSATPLGGPSPAAGGVAQ